MNKPPTHCRQLRRIYKKHKTVSFDTGAVTVVRSGWEILACSIPLTTQDEKRTGVCASCASGFSCEVNYPVEEGEPKCTTREE